MKYKRANMAYTSSKVIGVPCFHMAPLCGDGRTEMFTLSQLPHWKEGPEKKEDIEKMQEIEAGRRRKNSPKRGGFRNTCTVPYVIT